MTSENSTNSADKNDFVDETQPQAGPTETSESPQNKEVASEPPVSETVSPAPEAAVTAPVAPLSGATNQMTAAASADEEQPSSVDDNTEEDVGDNSEQVTVETEKALLVAAKERKPDPSTQPHKDQPTLTAEALETEASKSEHDGDQAADDSSLDNGASEDHASSDDDGASDDDTANDGSIKRPRRTKDDSDDSEGPSGLPSLMTVAMVSILAVFVLSAVLSSFTGETIDRDELKRAYLSNSINKIVYHDTYADVYFREGDLVQGDKSLRRKLPLLNAEDSNKHAEQFEKLKTTRENEATDLPQITTKIEKVTSADSKTLMYFLSTGLFFALFYFFLIRPLRGGAGGGILSFGKSRHREVGKKTGVRLNDVAGINEAKSEVVEIIEYLRNPERFTAIGARIPKGVLLVGPPGTGKTLLAKATAGEAGVNFYTAAGSDFVEMFAGVGASRVRDLFKTARENAPCILFLDEIDAVGRARNANIGANDERDQTLNQILVEMDGFGSDTTVIVMAATNRPDILDKALMRPGRFDRKIMVNLPDVQGRLGILKVHSERVRIGKDVDLEVIARATPGFSGAELEALINEAALAAALAGRKTIGHFDLEEARDKVRWGRQKQGRVMSPDEIESTAWHEAGHTLVGLLIPECDPVHKVTIIPRGMALGATMSLPEKDVVGLNKSQILAKIAMCFGGRIAEEMVTHDISTGAANDIEQATNLARRMVCEWGMSSEVGPVTYKVAEGPYTERHHSEATALKIDEQIRTIIEQEYQRAEKLLVDHKPALERIALGLLQYETITGHEAKLLVDGTSVKDLRPVADGAKRVKVARLVASREGPSVGSE